MAVDTKHLEELIGIDNWRFRILAIAKRADLIIVNEDQTQDYLLILSDTDTWLCSYIQLTSGAGVLIVCQVSKPNVP